jgi:hypothetical protein
MGLKKAQDVALQFNTSSMAVPPRGLGKYVMKDVKKYSAIIESPAYLEKKYKHDTHEGLMKQATGSDDIVNGLIELGWQSYMIGDIPYAAKIAQLGRKYTKVKSFKVRQVAHEALFLAEMGKYKTAGCIQLPYPPSRQSGGKNRSDWSGYNARQVSHWLQANLLKPRMLI